MTIKTHKKDEKDANSPESKPEKLAKIIYTGLVRLKATKDARKCGRNQPIGLDFGQPERVNTVAKIDKMEKKCR
jgi:hypothetical protein